MLTFLLLACVAKVDMDSAEPEEDDTSGGDTAADSGDTGDSDDPGEVYELGDPAFSVTLDGGAWESPEGYWVDLGDESTLRAEVEVTGAVQIVIITVEGDVSSAGTFAVASVEWVEQVSQAGDSFHYTANAPAGMTWTTLGFAEEDNLFGALGGEATATDSVGGGSIPVGAGSVESWPHY